MLDPKIVRKEPDRIIKMLKDRGDKLNPRLQALYELINFRSQFLYQLESDRNAINSISQDIANLKKNKKEVPKKTFESIGVYKDAIKEKENLYAMYLIRYLFELKEHNSFFKEKFDVEDRYQLQEKVTKSSLEKSREAFQDFLKIKGYEKITWDIEETIFESAVKNLPNLIDDRVPVGKIGEEQVNMKGKTPIPKFNFPVKNHSEIAEELDLIDITRAAKVSGARFYYLRNDLVKLNQALINYGLDFMISKGHSLVQPPYMINHKSMEGATLSEDFDEVIYKIEDEDLYLIGTSEHAMAAMHSNEIIEEGLPIKYAGISPCFRKEAGAHGRDEKGIFRVHQFEKIEQFMFTEPEQSDKEHMKMLENTREFYDSLELPYRVMLLGKQDMSKVSAITYDIEAWMPGQENYREIVSCSNCWDYQARRLKIRFREKTHEKPSYLHTLNSTLVATTRVLVSIMENYQTNDGHIRIPKVLQSYMGNQKEI